MLFLSVVKYFDFFAKMKIQFKRGMVHYMLKKCINLIPVIIYVSVRDRLGAIGVRVGR